MAQRLVVPVKGSDVPIHGPIPTTYEERIKFLRERREAMISDLEKSVPALSDQIQRTDPILDKADLIKNIAGPQILWPAGENPLDVQKPIIGGNPFGGGGNPLGGGPFSGGLPPSPGAPLTFPSGPSPDAPDIEQPQAETSSIGENVDPPQFVVPGVTSAISLAKLLNDPRVQPLSTIGAFVMPDDLADQVAATGQYRIVEALSNSFEKAGKEAVDGAEADLTHLRAIKLDPDKRAKCGAGVVVGIADVWLWENDEIPRAKATKSFDSQGNPIDDPEPKFHGHGSAVASLIAGKTIGVAPATTIVFASVLREDAGEGLSRFMGTPPQVARGIEYLALSRVEVDGFPGLHPVKIINASFVMDPAKVHGTELETIVNNLAASGVLLIAGTGNKTQGVGYPALTHDAIGVGALERKGEEWIPWTGTNQGDGKPDIWAPGKVHACSSGNSYEEWVGTSMATAVTTGCAAAILSTDLTMTPFALRMKLEEWADKSEAGLKCDLSKLP